MRIKPWMTTVASMLLLVAVQTETSGQQPMPPGAYPPGMAAMPVQGSGGPYVQQQPYATNNPQVIYPQGTPPGFEPWPQISPYYNPNVAVDQHVNRQGLWFRDMIYRERKYFGSIELMSVAFRDQGSSRIGNGYANRAEWDTQFPQGVPIDVDNTELVESPNFSPSIPGYFPVDTAILPFPALAASANVFNSMINGYFYPFRSTADMTGLGSTLGTQIRWGFENEDDTGVLLNGFWAFEDDARYTDGYDRINGVPVTQSLTQSLGGQNLRIRGTVAYYTGEPILGIPEFGAGRTAKYDILFDMKHTTESAGTNFNLYSLPIYKTSAVKIRPSYGARYLYIHEGFGFRGVDSGFTYDIDEETYRPSTSLTYVHDQYEAHLNSDVKSHLAGPEIGLRYDLGDDDSSFKMWGETIFGLLANNETINVDGDNIGDPLVEGRFENLLNPRMLDPTFQSQFADKKSNVHVSPVFQQSIFAEFAAFRSLPIIRKMSVFEDTSFRFGYTFLWVGEVSRPAEAIKWQGFPLYPEARVNRTSWWMHQLNFGVDWTF